MTPEAYSSRSVRVVLPASTCARIPKLSVFRDTRHTLRTGPKGHLDGRERLAHLPSLTIDSVLPVLNHTSDRPWLDDAAPLKLDGMAHAEAMPQARRPIPGPRRVSAGQPAWSFAPERAHLNHVVPSDRMRGRELDRLLPISAADDVDAGDELLSLHEQPVAEQRLPVADADRRGRVPAPQRVPQDLEAPCLPRCAPG